METYQAFDIVKDLFCYNSGSTFLKFARQLTHIQIFQTIQKMLNCDVDINQTKLDFVWNFVKIWWSLL